MKKNNAALNDEGFLESAWEWAGDVGAYKNVAVRIVLLPSVRKGIWRVRCQAVSQVDGRAIGTVLQTTAEFPNGRATTLAALVFTLLTELSVELDKDPLAQS